VQTGLSTLSPQTMLKYATCLICAAHAAAAPETCSTMGAPWFGASPTATPLTLHRRGWGACALCGGAERLGAIVDDIDATSLTSEQAAQILDAVRAHGVVVLKGQNLTRSQQVAFTAALGEVVVLPHSFEGKDPEPLHPAIQRVTNYFANGTWKGPGSKFGAYWHQDGQFWRPPLHNVLSVLHCRHRCVNQIAAARLTPTRRLVHRRDACSMAWRCGLSPARLTG